MHNLLRRVGQLVIGLVTLALCLSDRATTAKADEAKKLLVIGQGPDGHPPKTHEFMAGARVVEALLQNVDEFDVSVAKADEPWTEGPDRIAAADGIVLLVSEGARWVQQDVRRFEALNRLAARGGGLVALHWGIGTRDAKYIDGYLRLLGGVHGGPDRKYKFLMTTLTPSDHPVASGLKPIKLHDEFYYQLKFTGDGKPIQPVLQAEIDGELHTVAWAWERDDSGRSFGFSGLHYHENWRIHAYRKLVAQAILWTLKVDAPQPELELDEAVYSLDETIRPLR